MKLQTKRLILAAVFLVAVCGTIAFFVWNRPSHLDGSREKNPDAYLLDFTSMKQDDFHTLHLETGEALHVEFGVERGNVDVQIGMDGEEPIYRGNEVDNANFELPISQSGDYVISIQARNAQGFLHFTKKVAPDAVESDE